MISGKLLASLIIFLLTWKRDNDDIYYLRLLWGLKETTHAEYLAECLQDTQWMLISFDFKTDEFLVSIFKDVKLWLPESRTS